MMNGMHNGFGMGLGMGWSWIIGLAILAVIIWLIVKGINQRTNPKSIK
jgi:putative membrane protein